MWEMIGKEERGWIDYYLSKKGWHQMDLFSYPASADYCAMLESALISPNPSFLIFKRDNSTTSLSYFED